VYFCVSGFDWTTIFLLEFLDFLDSDSVVFSVLHYMTMIYLMRNTRASSKRNVQTIKKAMIVSANSGMFRSFTLVASS